MCFEKREKPETDGKNKKSELYLKIEPTLDILIGNTL